MLFKHWVYQYISLKNKELNLLGGQHSQVKLQAYERMTIFLERLKPVNLVNKFDKDLTAKELAFSFLEKSIKKSLNTILRNNYISVKSLGKIL